MSNQKKRIVYMTATELLNASRDAPALGVQTVHRMIAEIFRLRAKLRYLKAGDPVQVSTGGVTIKDPHVALPLTLEDRRAEKLFGLESSDINRVKLALLRLSMSADKIEEEVLAWETAFECETPSEALKKVAIQNPTSDLAYLARMHAREAETWNREHPEAGTTTIGEQTQPPSALDAQPPMPPADPGILPDDPPEAP